MPKFSSDSPEYRSNGHYVINGTECMSVWTYKRKKGGSTTDNETYINGPEGKELAKICSVVYSTVPDFGNFSEILVFPVEELHDYYSNK